jgi:hypothetical protein
MNAMAIPAGAGNDRPETRNDRFKESFGSWMWGSMIAATVLHFMLFQFWPTLTVDDVSFTAEELTIFSRMMAKASWYFATMHFQYQVQKLEDGDWEESRSLITYYCSMPGYQNFWASRERAHGPEFLQYVDNEIGKHRTALQG